MNNLVVIGIDLGGTSVKGGLFVGGTLKKSDSVPTNAKKGRDAIFASIDHLISKLGIDGVQRIGLVSAGDIDPVKGVCTYSKNLRGWSGAEIKKTLTDKYHLPVAVDNDAIGALVGEASYYPDILNVTMLTFGTGVGGACLIDGAISRDPQYAWGHRVLHENGIPCSCGRKGCAECYLSAGALFSMASAAYERSVNSFELMDYCRKGDEKAVAVMTHFCTDLNALMNLILKETPTQLIILGGGLMGAKDVFEKFITIDKNKYRFARLGNAAGIIGACKIAERL